MSRLANISKAGYFPSPENVVDLIATHIAPPAPPAYRALDPCAGEGIALARATKAIGGKPATYGIEIDADRAREAAKRLTSVLHASYENVRTTPGGYGLLWLNPPYDADTTQPGRRLEFAFLKRTADWLAPAGVLVYIIPDYRISPAIARFLASRFERVRVLRFPDAEYRAYKQVVVLAAKRAEAVQDPTTASVIGAYATLPAPMLTGGEAAYRIPAAPVADAPAAIAKARTGATETADIRRFIFRLADVPPEEAVAEARAAGAWGLADLADALLPPRIGEVRPLLPLKRGHVAMLLAGGALDNAVLERDGDRIVVKGRLEKIEVDRTTDDDEDEGYERTLETFRTRIEALHIGAGKIDVIENEAALRRWFGEWRDALLAHLAATARPVHTGDLGPYASILDALSPDRRLPGRRTTSLFEAQKHTAAAVGRFLGAGGRAAVVQATRGTGKTSIAVAVAELLRSRYRDAA